ncbi:MAG: ABC transporter substrate-binding protein, partial [Candidatus Hodarchaeota archaeon]
AVFYQNGEAWERQVQGLENNGVNFIVKQKFDMGEKDFRTMLFKIKNSQPDLIVVLGYGSHFPILFKQIEEVGLKEIPVLGGLDFLEVPEGDLGLYSQVAFVVPDFNVNPSFKSQKFIENFEEKFDTKPTHQAAYTYDIVELLYLGVRNTDANSENVVNYMKNMKSYEGVVGSIEILQDGDTKSSLTFATYKNGELAPYEEQ